MGSIIAICISKSKGTRKNAVPSALALKDHGLEKDAHAGNWHRQISLLALEKIEDFKRRGALVSYGDFGENLVVSGIDLAHLPVGAHLAAGEEVLLEISQIGKECHTRCAIYHSMGECIMPTQGVFAKVLHGGELRQGDAVRLID
jgi:MOSC domain-containing protein YiiM